MFPRGFSADFRHSRRCDGCGSRLLLHLSCGERSALASKGRESSGMKLHGLRGRAVQKYIFGKPTAWTNHRKHIAGMSTAELRWLTTFALRRSAFPAKYAATA